MLECIEVRDEAISIMADGPDGKPYATGQSEWLRYYVFKCQCGKKHKVSMNQFPGKRMMRDCGCGIGGDVGGTSMVRAISMPSDLWYVLENYVKVHGGTLSGTLQRAVRLGLKQVKGD